MCKGKWSKRVFGSQSAVAWGNAEETPTPVGGGELELIECTIETCLFVEIKCVHYIANAHTHTHTYTPERRRTHTRAQTHTFTYLYAYGGKLLPGRSNNIGLFIFFFFFPSAKQVDNLTLTRVLHRELLGKLFFFLAPGSLWLFTSRAKKNFVIIGTFSAKCQKKKIRRFNTTH